MRNSPRVGWWWAECCKLDLVQIENEQQLAEVLERISDIAGYWQTKEEALEELC